MDNRPKFGTLKKNSRATNNTLSRSFIQTLKNPVDPEKIIQLTLLLINKYDEVNSKDRVLPHRFLYAKLTKEDVVYYDAKYIMLRLRDTNTPKKVLLILLREEFDKFNVDNTTFTHAKFHHIEAVKQLKDSLSKQFNVDKQHENMNTALGLLKDHFKENPIFTDLEIYDGEKEKSMTMPYFHLRSKQPYPAVHADRKTTMLFLRYLKENSVILYLEKPSADGRTLVLDILNIEEFKKLCNEKTFKNGPSRKNSEAEGGLVVSSPRSSFTP